MTRWLNIDVDEPGAGLVDVDAVVALRTARTTMAPERWHVCVHLTGGHIIAVAGPFVAEAEADRALDGWVDRLGIDPSGIA